MRWLVKFGYDGTGFDGWARQPGRRTVEGEILRQWHRGRADSMEGSAPGFDVASRTDRGVSARGNALVLRSSLRADMLLRRLNGISPRMFFTAASPIPEEFRVRRAIRRTYRYFESGPVSDLEEWNRAAERFRGRVDARSFGRGVPSAVPCWRSVEAVTASEIDGGICIEVSAPSFVWGMVRKMVGALREHDRGRLPLARLEAAIAGRERLTLPMAEPEGLVLWDVEYPLRWEVEWSGPNRHQAEHARAARQQLWVRNRVLGQLFGPGTDRVAGSGETRH